VYIGGTVPLTLKVLRAIVVALIALVGGVACGGPSSPSRASGTPALPGATSVEPSPNPSPIAQTSFEDSIWYEVDRAGDLAGNARRTLLFGTVTGLLRGQVPLGVSAGGPGQAQAPFAVSDPQADGVFGRRVLVWGRDGQPGRIESIKLDTGELEELLETDDIVHVATADASLSQLFYIVVDSASHRPIGLWTASTASGEAVELTFDFRAEAVTNATKYRLATNNDGSLLAVQSGEQGLISVIDVEDDSADEFAPGGPLVGFGGDIVVAYGASSDTGSRPLLAYDRSMEVRVLTGGVSAAQIVPGTDGPLLVAMRTSETDAGYRIEVTSVETGESFLALVHEGADVAPLSLAVIGHSWGTRYLPTGCCSRTRSSPTSRTLLMLGRTRPRPATR
jgi:hypothetical protein